MPQTNVLFLSSFSLFFASPGREKCASSLPLNQPITHRGAPSHNELRGQWEVEESFGKAGGEEREVVEETGR